MAINHVGEFPAETNVSPTVLVGIGASAGGLDAMKTILSAIPPGCGLSFLIAIHGDSATKELLLENMRRWAKLAVDFAVNGASIAADKIYIAPNDGTLAIEHQCFRISAHKSPEQEQPLIDSCFAAVSAAWKSRAAGIILSGLGTDGALGLKSIAAAGGMTMVQLPSTAKRSEMPESAMAVAAADHVLAPEDMAGELIAYSQYLRNSAGGEHERNLRRGVENLLPAICEELLAVTGHNFKHYKSSTVSRRVLRRVQVLRLDSAAAYLERLKSDHTEVQELFNDLLIGVTAFFRDAEAFEALAKDVLPKIFAQAPADRNVRIWVAGCATGEEAYSIAILVREYLDGQPASGRGVQIFATDLDDEALSFARQGVYPASIAEQVSANRLKKYFVKKGSNYQVSREVRELVLFSVHNLISDPPFSRLDLISCRNLLIYLGAALQKKLLPLLHYALRPGGYLFLGPSESLTNFRELFKPVDAKHRISQRLGNALPGPGPLPGKGMMTVARHLLHPHSPESDPFHYLQRIIADEFAPKGVIVNDEGQVISASGNLEKYLSFSAGAFQNSITRLAREGLRIGVRSALSEAIKTRSTVVHDGLSVETSAGIQRVMVTIKPTPELDEDGGLFLVVFHDIGLPLEKHQGAAKLPSEDAAALVEHLERELSSARDDLERTVQELEAANEELKSSNEELLSMNEELQSANEELETSKEEVQAANDSLAQTNADLENLLASTQIATLFLDREGKLRRTTPAAATVFNVRPSDVGRPLSDFTHLAKHMPPLPDFESVCGAPSPPEDEIEMQDGTQLLRRVLPYRTHEGDFLGTVVTFTDITARSREQRRQSFLAKLHAVIQSMVDPDEIVDTTARLLAEHIGADRCAYSSVEDEAEFIITGDYSPQVPSIVGRWKVAAFGDACLQAMLADEPFIVEDTDSDPRITPADLEAYRAASIRAVICIPLHKAGKFVAAMAVHQQSPRQWSELEIELVRTVVGRCWESLERSNYHRALQESLERFRITADHTPALIWISDRSKNCTWFNRPWLEFTGRSMDEELGEGWMQGVHPDDLDCCRDVFNSNFDARSPFTLEYRLRRGDGSYRWVLDKGVPLYKPGGEFIGFIGSCIDITEKKAGEERAIELLQLEKRQSTLLRRVAEVSRLVYSDLSVNAICRVLADQAREIIGAHLATVSLGDPTDTTLEVHTVSSSEEHSSFGLQVPPLTGVLAAPLTGHGGVKLGLIHLSNKIEGSFTEGDEAILTQLAAIASVGIENARLYESLRDQDRRKDQFLATLAHELRNPLAPIGNALQAWSLVERNPEEARRLVEMMERQVWQMTRLIDDLLDVSRISRGKIELRKEALDLAAVIEGAIEAIKPFIDSRNHKLHLSLAQEPITLEGDPGRLMQVFGNLIHNAAKYSGRDSEIWVDLRREGRYAVVRIKDTGAGIPKHDLAYIFDIFVQLDQTLNRAHGGLGIGLTLVKTLVELHGGSVQAFSEGKSRGSEFVVRLPAEALTKLEVRKRKKRESKLTPLPESRRILVVDDVRASAYTLAMILKGLNQQVEVAYDGETALQLVQSFRPDVAFLDISMPGMNGYELAQHICKLNQPQPVLVALTGYGQEEDRRRAFAAGFNHHMVKPASVDAIHELLSTMPEAAANG